MASTITLIQHTSAEWTSLNPILTIDEVGIETDTMKLKAGDGVKTWNALSYGQVWESVNTHPGVEEFKTELEELFPGI